MKAKHVILILISSLLVAGCATFAKQWKEPVYKTYIDKDGRKQFEMIEDKDGNKSRVVLYWIHHMKTGFGSDVDFKKETLKARMKSPVEGLVSMTGQKVLQEE